MVSSHVSPVSPASSTSPVSRSPLALTLDALRASLARYQATFDAARVRRAELGPFASPGAVLAALDASSPLPDASRYALIAAIVREHASHTAGPALWSSLLLVAFQPLLLRTRAKLGRPEDTEHDARTLAAFLEALARLRTIHDCAYASVALQRGLLKALGKARAADREDTRHAAFDEGEHTRSEPHALTLGDACADLAWADARERKLAAIPRWKTERARIAARESLSRPSHSPSTFRLPLTHQPQTTFAGVSP